jgi:hypothetical protein
MSLHLVGIVFWYWVGCSRFIFFTISCIQASVFRKHTLLTRMSVCVAETSRLGVPGGPPRICAGNRDAAATGLVQASSLDGLEPPWVRPAPPRLLPQEGEVICPSVSRLPLSFWRPGHHSMKLPYLYYCCLCIPHKNSGLQLCYLLNTIVITCILWTRFLTQVIIPSFFSCLSCNSSVHGSWFGWSQTHNMNCCGTIACVLILAGVLLFGSSLHDLLRVLLLLPSNRSFSFLCYFLQITKKLHKPKRGWRWEFRWTLETLHA